ncbi:hypothetical protein O0235_09440 [Tepidiforma flava]|uniref:Type II toxin-antitoxin system VapC family toxin n=1 Tax=Tepidiforma flava TaxID=3004094 RepID=A0ABY7M3Q4_9CHLR|nr:hypothetical protein [Tepidiforma flava]WBL35010.1 hypothetical protein O0235_09440 [Tepidiforma flava]
MLAWPGNSKRRAATAYDLAYVAAARELGVPLVTGDRQVLVGVHRAWR